MNIYLIIIIINNNHHHFALVTVWNAFPTYSTFLVFNPGTDILPS